MIFTFVVGEIFAIEADFTNEVDYFTFLVGFYMMKNCYICGCNTPLPGPPINL